MKDKLLIFVIGLLLGAVISTGAFFAYSKATSCNNTNNAQMQMPGGRPPSDQGGKSGQSSEPPAKPGENNTQTNGNNNNTQTDNQNSSN